MRLRGLSYLGATVMLSVLPAIAAPKQPVQWTIKAAPASQKAGAKFQITIHGSIGPGWHLYALEEPQGGPVATEVALTDGDPADLLRVEQGKPRVVPDPVFQLPTAFFEGSVDFILRLQADRTPGTRPLHVLIHYQSCNDRVCLPPHTDTVEVPLTITR